MTDETRTITVTLDEECWARINRLIKAHPDYKTLEEFAAEDPLNLRQNFDE